MQISISEIPNEMKKDAKELLSKPLGFGKNFCDKMFKLCWDEKRGWHDAEICAYAPLSLDPAALVLHYAQEAFEGMKAYRLPDGGIGMFRPDMNCRRMNTSARRLVMPEIAEEDQLQAIVTLLKELDEWIPSGEGQSLYIRPTLFATNPVLGIRPGTEYLFMIICSPVAAYFERGFAPVRIATSEKYVRAAVGGLGAVKAGANYVASLLAAKSAKEKGYDQVLWLDAVEHRYIEEMGAMNIFFVYGDTLTTCPLTGSILPGITRDSILRLAPDLGYKVEERLLDVEDATVDIDSGKITEVFACGTAAVITAVSVLGHKDKDHGVGNGEPGEITLKLYKALTGIQTGKAEDPYDWLYRVK